MFLCTVLFFMAIMENALEFISPICVGHFLFLRVKGFEEIRKHLQRLIYFSSKADVEGGGGNKLTARLLFPSFWLLSCIRGLDTKKNKHRTARK